MTNRAVTSDPCVLLFPVVPGREAGLYGLVPMSSWEYNGQTCGMKVKQDEMEPTGSDSLTHFLLIEPERYFE